MIVKYSGNAKHLVSYFSSYISEYDFVDFVLSRYDGVGEVLSIVVYVADLVILVGLDKGCVNLNGDIDYSETVYIEWVDFWDWIRSIERDKKIQCILC